MHKSVNMWALLSAIGIFFILGTSMPSVLFSMFVTGIILGTAYALPVWMIVTLYPILALIGLYWIFREPLYIGEIQKISTKSSDIKIKRVAKKKPVAKHPVAKRRQRVAS